MPLPFVFAALPPEITIRMLLGGPGASSTRLTSETYSVLADRFAIAAANIDGAVSDISASWVGSSSNNAQGAFRNYAMWLRKQADVAKMAAERVDRASDAFDAAAQQMRVVEAALIAHRAKVAAAAVAASSTGVGVLTLAALQAEYAAIAVAAGTVMTSYGAGMEAALAGLPAPLTAPPIVGGGGGPDLPGTSGYSAPDGGPPGGPPSGGGGSGPPSPPSGGSDGPSHGSQGPSDGSSNGSSDGPGQGGDRMPTDPAQPADPSTPAGEADRLLPDMDPGASNLDPTGMPDGASDQQGFYGTSPYSTTLAGLNGGVGSLVALGMTGGGVGSMSGSATGFRMPSTWSRMPGGTFGAVPNTGPTTAPVRNAPPRGATAPKARMRRRRDDEEERKNARVFVPGEPEEVPVLEKPPVIGVIESSDGDRGEELDFGVPVLAGVIEHVDGDLPEAIEERPR